jgi:TPR repeat protein
MPSTRNAPEASTVATPAMTCDELAGDPDDVKRRMRNDPVTDIKDASAAISACKTAITIAEKSGAREILPRLNDQLGRAFDAAGSYQEEARDHYRISAEGGYPPGMAHYAFLLLQNGMPEAAVNYLASAVNGSIFAAYKMGDFYWTGFHHGLVPANKGKSIMLINFAASFGYRPAMNHPSHRPDIR